jgi:hypothetical protein
MRCIKKQLLSVRGVQLFLDLNPALAAHIAA